MEFLYYFFFFGSVGVEDECKTKRRELILKAASAVFAFPAVSSAAFAAENGDFFFNFFFLFLEFHLDFLIFYNIFVMGSIILNCFYSITRGFSCLH